MLGALVQQFVQLWDASDEDRTFVQHGECRGYALTELHVGWWWLQVVIDGSHKIGDGEEGVDCGHGSSGDGGVTVEDVGGET